LKLLHNLELAKHGMLWHTTQHRLCATAARAVTDISVPERGDLSNATCLFEAKPIETTSTKNEFLTFLAR